MQSRWFDPDRPQWTRVLSMSLALLFAILVRFILPSAGVSGGLFLAANAFQWVDWMAMESLFLLKNRRGISSAFNSSYNKEYGKPFAVGETVRVKKPQRYTIRNGLGYSAQPLNRIFTTITMLEPFGIDFEYDSFEHALRMERGEAQISKEYLAPAMSQIGQEIDSRCAQFAYQNANNIVGSLGTDPTTFDLTSAAARQRMVELAGASDGTERDIFVPPSVMRSVKGSSLTLFNPVTDISKQFRTGIVGYADGFDWSESMSLYRHTAGTWAGPVTVTTAPVDGATTLAVTCTTGDTFNVGDVFSVINSNQVNPMTRRMLTTTAKPFVITVAAVGVANAATLTISPAIYGPGSQYQNVDAMPVAGAALTLFPGTSSPNGKAGANGLWLGRNAFALVGVALDKPESAEVAWTRQDPETGIAISFIRAFDPIQRKWINRFDCAIGLGVLYGDEEAGRILAA